MVRIPKLTQLRETNPDWTQQRIADEVGVDKAYVSRTLTKRFETNQTVNADNFKSKRDRADYRKLPEDVRAKVDAKEIRQWVQK